MKKINYLAMLLAAGMFAACSDTLEDATGGTNTNTPATGEGYVKVAINMPTTSGAMTRADDDDKNTGSNDVVLDDGIANEYKVTDGAIVFFKTTSEEAAKNPDANATFVSAYKLGELTVTMDPSTQVTERVATVTEAPMVDATKNEALYALVFLNVPTTVVVDADAHTLTLNGTALTSTDKLEKFTTALSNQTLATYIGNSKDDFTMSNAPLSTEDGGDNTYSTPAAKTLVPVTVYETQEAAEANDAARIYVERVVAKVTLKGFIYSNSKYTKTVTSEGVYKGDIVQLDGWALNVTNKSTSLVRNVEGFKASTETNSWLAAATSPATNETSRFAGTQVIPIKESTNYYRIYWAKDGNYDSATPATDFDTFYTGENGSITPSEPTWNENTSDNNTDVNKDYALYCLENTMDYDQQLNNRSTTVVLKTKYLTKFGNGEATAQNFFICGANPTKYPDADVTVTSPEQGTIDGICSYVIKAANEVLETGDQIDNDVLELNSSADAGTYNSVDDIKNLFKAAEGKSITDDQWNAIWNQVGTIKYYKGGISYYYDDIYVRHFNDSETPWNDGEEYGIQHLGRYGVVRNNWYEVNVNSISGPGEPSIDQPDGEDNDDAEGYINCQINVLSWAKRSQSVDL